MLNKILEAGSKGGWILAIVISLVTVGVIYSRPSVPVVGTPPATVEKKVLPTTGEAGYPVLDFCQDKDTKVTGPYAIADGEFAGKFQLDRTKDGVHEQVDVGFYADPNKEPRATHYDSSNNPSDGLVTKEAMACIAAKAQPPVR